ncbi:MAG: extracellular solute-binding protein [Clostridiales bacterium]|nr:extracellular solute-binding protein [Clostridiales bacterium]
MTRKLLSLLVAIVMVMTAIPFALAEDAPMKITVAGYMFGPIDDAKDVVTPAVEKMLLEKHGINVDIEVEYIEYNNYSEILAPRLSGGTAPDVFLALSSTTLDTYYDQGVIASWDVDFFKENAPDVWAFVEGGGVNGDLADQFDMWLEYAMKDGKMVVLPSLKPDGNMPYKTLIYRGDWLDNLGVSEDELPKTVDEYVDLMTRFAKEDPDQDGENDTFGFSLTGMKTLFGAYGMYNGFLGGTSYWYEEDGELINPDVSPKSKIVVELLRDLYANGVIDPEFVKGKESADGAYWAASAGLINGLYGASANASIDHFRLKEVLGDDGGPVAKTYWEVNGPDAKFVYAPWPAGPDGDYGWSVGYAVAVGESAVYNKALEEDPDKLATIFKILNAFATDDELYMLASWGIEGVTYTNENGKLSRLLDNAGLNEVGVWGCRSLYGADRAFSELAYNLAFYNDASIANRLNYFKLDQYNSYIQDAVSETLPSQGKYLSDLQTIRDEAYTNFIRGDRPLDEWDAYVEEYMTAGGQILHDEANEWFANK